MLINQLTMINFKYFAYSDLFEAKNDNFLSHDFDYMKEFTIEDGDSEIENNANNNDTYNLFNLKNRNNITSEKDLQPYIHYNQLSANFNNFLKIKDPRFNDIVLQEDIHPEEEFKDAFQISYEYKYDNSLLIQKSPDLTKFDRSNFVYFQYMPLIYPMVNKKGSKKTLTLKQLTVEQTIKNNIDYLKRNETFTSFNTKFMLKSMDPKFNPKIKITKILIQNKNRVNQAANIDEVERSNDYLESFLDNDINRDPSFNKKNNKFSSYKQLANSNGVEIDEDYMKMKVEEIEEKMLKDASDELYYNGFLEFPTYEEKLEFIKSYAFIFGLHVHECLAKFMDADFLNCIKITPRKKCSLITNSKNSLINPLLNSNSQDNEKNNIISIHETLHKLNLSLKANNYNNMLLQIPEYSDSNIFRDYYNPTESVFIRWNNFSSCCNAYDIFNNDINLKEDFRVSFVSNPVSYYNEHFISGFDLVLQNTLSNFNSLLSVKSDYKIQDEHTDN